MAQEPKQKVDPKIAGRLGYLRKLIATPEDAELVKEMISDGLSDEDIAHALGHVSGIPAGVLPEGHEHAHAQTTEQQEAEARAAEVGQPGDVSGDEGGSEGGEEEDDPLSHVAALLTSMSKKKVKNSKQSRPAGGNSR